MTSEKALKYCWGMICILVLVCTVIQYVTHPYNIFFMIGGFVIVLIVLTIFTALVHLTLKGVNKDKGTLAADIAKTYHVEKKNVIIVGRRCYVTLPNKHETVKINMRNLKRTVIKDHY